MIKKEYLKKLFWLMKANFCVSSLSFGGGYVVIPLIKKSFVDDKKVFSEGDLMEMAAVAQSSPGAIAINLAALAGYKVAGFWGAVVSCIAAVLPPLIVLTIIAASYQKLIENSYINAALKGMAAGMAAIIINVVFTMSRYLREEKQYFGIFIAIGVFLSTFVFKVSAILTIFVTVIIYFAISNWKLRRSIKNVE